MTYSQKVDWRQLVIVAGIFALGGALLAGLTPLSPALAKMDGWLLVALGVLAAWEAFATRYEFTRTELVIHGGATCQRIRYDTIEAVRVARGWLARICSPGAVRLLVGSRTSAGEVSLRPRDRDRFLDELTRAVPWLAVTER
jgi:hypothetical protein